jgi:hypothetical protein
MGAWGPGLYQDDEALDLKNTIALLAKMPGSGDRVLEILLQNQSEPPEFDRDGGPAFWLVVADQFERRGIACDIAQRRALAAIDEGEDLRDLKARDMGEKDLRKRAKLLQDLKARLLSPRPVRERPQRASKPSMVVEPGDVFTYPTMGGVPMNPWSGRDPIKPHGGAFVPDGWGALIVLATGRAYDWFPWCTYSGVSPWQNERWTLEDVRRSRLTMPFVYRGVPRSRHLKRIGALHIGRLALAVAAVDGLPIDKAAQSPEYVVYAGWSPTGYCNRTPEGEGVKVTDFLTETH